MPSPPNTRSQRTRRPSLPEGGSLRSLGEPLKRSPLAGRMEHRRPTMTLRPIGLLFMMAGASCFWIGAAHVFDQLLPNKRVRETRAARCALQMTRGPLAVNLTKGKRCV